MNELHTPPGYAEYPRDAKSLPQRDSDRLAGMAKGYSNLRWVIIVCAIPLHSFPKIPDVGELLAACVFLIAQFLIFNRVLSKIFRGKGWSEWIAAVAAVLPEVAAIVRMERLLPDSISLVIYVAVVFGIALTAHFVVFREFAKFGLKFKLHGWTSERALLDVVSSLRTKELQAVSRSTGGG